jgi:hypothetical protein
LNPLWQIILTTLVCAARFAGVNACVYVSSVIRLLVFESTEMERLDDHSVYTHGGSITADRIIIAVDKLTPSISPLAVEIFHAQTFMSVSVPLTDKELGLCSPAGSKCSAGIQEWFIPTSD